MMSVGSFAAAFPEAGPRLAWFFGAGTSASAGIPTGYDMILDFKTRLFCAATGLPRRGRPEATRFGGNESRCTSMVQTAYRRLDHQRNMPQLSRPSIRPKRRDGHTSRMRSDSDRHRSVTVLFAALVCQRLVPCAFTTNFDPLIENSVVAADDQLAAGDRVHVTVAALDSVERAERCLRDSSWPLIAKLHGDYKSDRLMNTPTELTQDTALRRVLLGTGARFGFAVAGYSGRDQSVMDALLEIAAQEGGFPGGLYWFTRPRTPILPAVHELLETAAGNTTARLIEVENFDELAGELDRQVVHTPALESVVRGARIEPRLVPVTIPTDYSASFPVLRCSALPLLEMPTEARRVELETPATTREVQQLLRDSDARAVAACRGTTVAVFGRDEAVLAALSSLRPRLAGTVPLDPANDSWALGLVYEALVRALAPRRPLRPVLRRTGHALIVRPPDPDRRDQVANNNRVLLRAIQQAYSEAITGSVPPRGSPFAEAVQVRLEMWLDRWWVVFDPFTWVDLPNVEERPASDPALADWRRERWARRYNKKWAAIINAWAHLLAPERETTLQAAFMSGGDGLPGNFRLSQVTAWSRPGQQLMGSLTTGGRT